MMRHPYKVFAALCWLPLAGLAIFSYYLLAGLSGHSTLEPPNGLLPVIESVVIGMPVLGSILFISGRWKKGISYWWLLPVWISSTPLLLWIYVLLANR